MLKLITAKTSILLPGGIIMKTGESFMCETAFAEKLIKAKSAIEVEKSENNPKTPEEMTINELKEFAEQNNIPIPEDLTKKADIYAAVKAGLEIDDAQNV